jgi:DNA gyrase subunit A
MKVHQIPEGQASGVPLSNLLTLETDETMAGLVAVPDFKEGGFLTLCTAQGRIKRTGIEEFAAVRAGGLMAITLDSGDELRFVRVTPGGQELILVTAQGQALRFKEDEVRAMGRSAAGVNAIKLDSKDEPVGMDVVDSDAALVVVSTKGYGKRTALAEYPTQSRYGKGVATFAAKTLAQTGQLAAACVAREDDEIGIVSTGGAAALLKVSDLPAQSRSTRGVAIVQLKGTDKVIGVAYLQAKTRPPRQTDAKAASPSARAAKGKKRAAAPRTPPKKTSSAKATGKRVARASSPTEAGRGVLPSLGRGSTSPAKAGPSTRKRRKTNKG